MPLLKLDAPLPSSRLHLVSTCAFTYPALSQRAAAILYCHVSLLTTPWTVPVLFYFQLRANPLVPYFPLFGLADLSSFARLSVALILPFHDPSGLSTFYSGRLGNARPPQETGLDK
jgi:hypothetical protein